MTAPLDRPAFDLIDPDRMERQGPPLDELARLRQTAPVSWYPTEFHELGFDDDGYWVVTRHADVTDVSLRSDVFSTYENTAICRFGPDMDRDAIEMQRAIILNQDPPQHSATRKIISRAFTPRAVDSLRDALAERAQRIVHEAKGKGVGNFVEDVAAELPLQAIADLLGIPQEDRRKVFDWSNGMLSATDMDAAAELSAQFVSYAWNMAEERMACPRDDIATTLLHATVEEGALTQEEFCFFVLALAVAGNETTRNAITHGMKAMLDNPAQWELYRAERPATTADEIVRWATPVHAFQRTALADTQVGGVEVAKGQRVVMFYSSANYDTDVFTDPYTFDIRRNPNPHLGFGGRGIHYCIGANLAKLEIDLIFGALADHMPGLRAAGELTRMNTGWLNAITAMPVTYA